MIDFKTFLEIKYLHQHRSLKCSQIAKQLGLDERTGDKWLNEKSFRPRESTPRESKLDAFKEDIVRMLESYPYTTALILPIKSLALLNIINNRDIGDKYSGIP